MNTKFILVLLALFAPFISLGQTTVNKNQSANRHGVYDNDFFRNTFYTWTTEEQIKELRKDQTLLTKSKSETKGYSLFDISLRDSALKGNPFAELLQEEQFAKKRFAWTNAWATIMGWKGETYGNQLIKIVLNDSAIIGKFNASNRQEPFRFFDLKGQKLTSDYVIKNKNRIAAIYHVNSYKGNRLEWKRRRKGTYSYDDAKKKNNKKTNIPFREFVIINEKMIKNWSYGTSDLKTEIVSEIEQLKQFQKSKEANQMAFSSRQSVWGINTENTNRDIELYNASTCFQNNNYLFNSKKIKQIIEELELALKKQSDEIVK